MASLVKTVGSDNDAASGTTSVVTVPAGGVAAGNVLVVSLHCAASSSTFSTVVDSKGNTYTERAAETGGCATEVYTCTVTTPLVSGDTITATVSTARERCMIVDEYEGIDEIPLTIAEANSFGAAPSVAIVPASAPCLLVAMCGFDRLSTVTFTENTGNGWTQNLRTGNASAASSLNTARQEVATTASKTYAPTWTPATSCDWGEAILAMEIVAGAAVQRPKRRRQVASRSVAPTGGSF